MFGILIDKQTKMVLDKNVIINEHCVKETEEVIPYDHTLGNPVGPMNKPKFEDGVWVDTDPIASAQEESTEIDMLRSENTKLWDTVHYLLKMVGSIPPETTV